MSHTRLSGSQPIWGGFGSGLSISPANLPTDPPLCFGFPQVFLKFRTRRTPNRDRKHGSSGPKPASPLSLTRVTRSWRSAASPNHHAAVDAPDRRHGSRLAGCCRARVWVADVVSFAMKDVVATSIGVVVPRLIADHLIGGAKGLQCANSIRSCSPIREWVVVWLVFDDESHRRCTARSRVNQRHSATLQPDVDRHRLVRVWVQRGVECEQLLTATSWHPKRPQHEVGLARDRVEAQNGVDSRSQREIDREILHRSKMSAMPSGSPAPDPKAPPCRPLISCPETPARTTAVETRQTVQSMDPRQGWRSTEMIVHPNLAPHGVRLVLFIVGWSGLLPWWLPARHQPVRLRTPRST